MQRAFAAAEGGFGPDADLVGEHNDARFVQGLWLLDARHPAATNLTRRKARVDFGAMWIVRYDRGI